MERNLATIVSSVKTKLRFPSPNFLFPCQIVWFTFSQPNPSERQQKHIERDQPFNKRPQLGYQLDGVFIFWDEDRYLWGRIFYWTLPSNRVLGATNIVRLRYDRWGPQLLSIGHKGIICLSRGNKHNTYRPRQTEKLVMHQTVLESLEPCWTAKPNRKFAICIFLLLLFLFCVCANEP